MGIEEVMAGGADEQTACKVILAGMVAKPLLVELAEGLAKLAKVPKLVGFLANADPAARSYANWTERTCNEK